MESGADAAADGALAWLQVVPTQAYQADFEGPVVGDEFAVADHVR